MSVPSSQPPSTRQGADIQLEAVDIRLGTNEVVAGFSLHIQPGEFVCLLGPSGCGKSTVMNAIGGFVVPRAGRITMNGHAIQGPGVERGIVFQSTESLFPWLTVRQNVEYGPRVRGVPAAQRRSDAERYIQLVGLGHAIDQLPDELSGGMRQRAQIARVLVNEPAVILMDEPFGALDAQTRLVMQGELERIWRATRSTVLFITHDIGEAVLLGDRVVTMTRGPAARIKSVTQVGIDHPRDLTRSQETELYRRLRTEIGEEVAQTLNG